MVRHHVAQRAGFFVEAAAGLDADGLVGGDLNVVDVIAIPQRLEDAVGEAQHQNVLDGFFAEEMIDAVDLLLGQYLEDLGVERLRRGKVVPEGFFNDHPPPCFLGLAGEARPAPPLRPPTQTTSGAPPTETGRGPAAPAPPVAPQTPL